MFQKESGARTTAYQVLLVELRIGDERRRRRRRRKRLTGDRARGLARRRRRGGEQVAADTLRAGERFSTISSLHHCVAFSVCLCVCCEHPSRTE